MNILFIDTDCPEPCNGSALDSGPLGGTEASLLRVAAGLAAQPGWRVTVAQHNRTLPASAPGPARAPHFVPYIHGQRLPDDAPDPDAIVVLRNFKILARVRKCYPRARLFLWMHCYPGKQWKRAGAALAAADAKVIAVSHALRRTMTEVLESQLAPFEAARRVTSIYNPVVVHPVPKRVVDPDKLVFFSSPHKGLEEVLEHFQHVRGRFPAMRLYLADPGYWRGPAERGGDGVVRLGSLPPAEIHRHVAEALCVFYPQTRFAETFGLVFAEANALGTPVLAHPLGAAEEVLGRGGLGQITDCSDPALVVERIARWRDGARPRTQLDSSFRLASIIQRWRWVVGFSKGRSESDPGALPAALTGGPFVQGRPVSGSKVNERVKISVSAC